MANPGGKMDWNAPGPLLALVLSAAAVLYLWFFNAVGVPNLDFFAYRNNALGYLHGLLPSRFKRLPLFPVLIGLLSLIMPGPEPELLAAQVLNLLLALVCLWLIYRIAREFVKPSTSLAIVALCAVNRAMVNSVAEPMQEITILACVLWTVLLALRGSPWAYVAAFLASLTRFEAALLIPLVVLQDRLTTTEPRRTRSLLWGALASLGIIGWIALSLQARTMHPYLEEMLVRQGNLLAFVKGALRVAGDFLPRALFGADTTRRAVFLIELTLLVGGAAMLVRRHRARMTVLLGLLGTYTVIHTVFPAYVDRYVVPVLWLLYLLLAAGIEAMIARIGSPIRAPLRWAAGAAVCAMIGFGTASTVRFMTSDRIRLNRMQFRRVGEWYRGVAGPGDKMVAQFTSIIQYYSGLPRAGFMQSRSLESKTPEALPEELRAKGVTYIVGDNFVDGNSYYATRDRAWLLSWLNAHRLPGLEPVHAIREGPNEAVIYRVLPKKTITEEDS